MLGFAMPYMAGLGLLGCAGHCFTSALLDLSSARLRRACFDKLGWTMLGDAKQCLLCLALLGSTLLRHATHRYACFAMLRAAVTVLNTARLGDAGLGRA